LPSEFAKILSVPNQILCCNDGEEEFMSSLRNVVERLKGLETERKNLLLEIEELKKMADSKAKALESEVSMLREEVKSLRVLLGAEETEPALGQKKKR
jgi:predicted  nucleic acid-binding Zn-ribbon protein